MTNHEPFEILCALAVTGQLPASEKATFDEHCLQCPACRRQVLDLISVGSQLQFHAALHAISSPMPEGALERFRARAVHEGIALRSGPARSSSLYALATAAAVFIIVTTLVLMPGTRKAPERLATSSVAPMSARQTLPAAVAKRKPAPRTSKAIHAQLVRHRFVPHTDTAMDEAVLTPPRFPREITVSYSFLGSEGKRKSLAGRYPVLSPSQISHFALFPKATDSGTTNVASIGTFNRSFDVALIGKIFDFATNSRPGYFQLPTAQ